VGLPDGGADPGEALTDTARRELAEETGILLDHLGPHLWDCETRFHYPAARAPLTRERLPRPRHLPCGPSTGQRESRLIEHRRWTNPNWSPAATNSYLSTFRRCSSTGYVRSALDAIDLVTPLWTTGLVRRPAAGSTGIPRQAHQATPGANHWESPSCRGGPSPAVRAHTTSCARPRIRSRF
jgi:hypothetical protein